MRGAVTTLIVLTVPVMVALPALGHAQSPTITRGALGGSLPPDSSSGLLRGSVPPGATTGVVRGTLPPGGTAGLLQAPPPGATVGVFRDTAAAARVPVMPGGLPPALTPVLMGPLPADASVGALTAPVSPGTRLGAPGPDEIMKGLDSQARIYLQDGNYAQGEQMLNGSVAIREDMVGRVSPGGRRSPRDRRSAHAPLQPGRGGRRHGGPRQGDPHEAGAAAGAQEARSLLTRPG